MRESRFNPNSAFLCCVNQGILLYCSVKWIQQKSRVFICISYLKLNQVLSYHGIFAYTVSSAQHKKLSDFYLLLIFFLPFRSRLKCYLRVTFLDDPMCVPPTTFILFPYTLPQSSKQVTSFLILLFVYSLATTISFLFSESFPVLSHSSHSVNNS